MPEMTIEKACVVLNEAKWLGYKWEMGSDSVFAKGYRIYWSREAIAIARGILDRRRVVELESELRLRQEDLMASMKRETLVQEQLAQVTAERDEAKAQGFAEGVEAAANAMCSICDNPNGNWNAAEPESYAATHWIHRDSAIDADDDSWTSCEAGAIHALIPTPVEKEPVT